MSRESGFDPRFLQSHIVTKQNRKSYTHTLWSTESFTSLFLYDLLAKTLGQNAITIKMWKVDLEKLGKLLKFENEELEVRDGN